MSKRIDVFKIILVIMLLILIFAQIINYNNGKDLSKLLDDFIANENYTKYHVSITIDDDKDYKYYSLDDKELLVDILNYFKGLKPIKIYSNSLYEDKVEKLNKNYRIYIESSYYVNQKKEKYTLKEQKTDSISIEISESNRIYVSSKLDTDYKEKYSDYYKINQAFDENFIYNIIEKYNMKDNSRD